MRMAGWVTREGRAFSRLREGDYQLLVFISSRGARTLERQIRVVAMYNISGRECYIVVLFAPVCISEHNGNFHAFK